MKQPYYLINGKFYFLNSKGKLELVKERLQRFTVTHIVLSASGDEVTPYFYQNALEFGAPSSNFSFKRTDVVMVRNEFVPYVNLNKNRKYSCLHVIDGDLVVGLANPYVEIVAMLIAQTDNKRAEKLILKQPFSLHGCFLEEDIQRQEAVMKNTWKSALKLSIGILSATVDSIYYYHEESDKVLVELNESEETVYRFLSEPAVSSTDTKVSLYANGLTTTFSTAESIEYFRLLLLEYGRSLGEEFVNTVTEIADLSVEATADKSCRT